MPPKIPPKMCDLPLIESEQRVLFCLVLPSCHTLLNAKSVLFEHPGPQLFVSAAHQQCEFTSNGVDIVLFSVEIVLFSRRRNAISVQFQYSNRCSAGWMLRVTHINTCTSTLILQYLMRDRASYSSPAGLTPVLSARPRIECLKLNAMPYRI